jgi:hypothetical protein
MHSDLFAAVYLQLSISAVLLSVALLGNQKKLELKAEFYLLEFAIY